MTPKNRRRLFLSRALGTAAALMMAGCDRLSRTDWFPKVLDTAERLSSGAQHLVTSRKSMAQ